MASVEVEVHRNYCLDCDWSASERDRSRGDLGAAAIAHAVETGHDIDSDLAIGFDGLNADFDVHVL